MYFDVRQEPGFFVEPNNSLDFNEIEILQNNSEPDHFFEENLGKNEQNNSSFILDKLFC